MTAKFFDIVGPILIEPRVYPDSRGYFSVIFEKNDFSLVSQTEFIQDNESKSSYGVLRGLHFQKEPFAQAKLVRCVKGQIMDVAVDIRPDSDTFGKYVSVILDEDNHHQLYIPRGFAHGFVVLSDEAIVQYKCDNIYMPSYESGIIWNDSDLNIDWMIPEKDIILSDKDKVNLTLKDLKNNGTI